MSLKLEFYNKYQKIEFCREFEGQYQKLRLAVKESNIDDIVKYWKCCRAIAKKSRFRYLFDRTHEWCCDMNMSTEINKDLFKEANKLMKKSK